MRKTLIHPGLILLVAVGLGAWLRLYHLATLPGWYPDEGSNIAIAADMASGNIGYMVFGQSSFITPRPPLFFLPLMCLFQWLGVDILWARLLSTSCGLLAMVLLYPVASRLLDRRIALVAVLFYAIYPAAVVYSRLAFTYNLLAPLYLLTLYALDRYLEQDRGRWFLLAVLCAGLAPLTDLAGIAAPLFVLVALLRRPHRLPLAILLIALPTLIWALWMTALGGDAFLFDVRFALARSGGGLADSLARFIFLYRSGLEGELWLALGSLGLLFLPRRRARWLVGGLHFASLFLLARTTAFFGQATYYLIPLFPLVAIGMGWLLVWAVPIFVRGLTADLALLPAARRPDHAGPRRWVTVVTAALLFAILLSPFVSMVAEGLLLDYQLFTARLGSTLADPQDARQAAAYVNARTEADDVVLASPTIAWLLDSRAADLQMAIAATGQATQHFPADIPPSRFRFDPRLENATYVILDPLWRGWGAAQMAEVARMVETVEADWLLERTIGSFEVYRNPHRQ